MTEAGTTPPQEAAPSIWLNGRPHPLPPEGALARVLEGLGVGPEAAGVAVAVNGQVVRRSDWATWRLSPGDRVEVVQAVQGG